MTPAGIHLTAHDFATAFPDVAIAIEAAALAEHADEILRSDLTIGEVRVMAAEEARRRREDWCEENQGRVEEYFRGMVAA